MLIYNNCDLTKLKTFIEIVDSITITMNFTDSTINKELENVTRIIRWININDLIILSFMPILLNTKEDVELLKVSKIKYREFSNLFTYFWENVDCIYRFSDYTITRRFRIILPNGDVAVINENFIIGNLLKDDRNRIEKNLLIM